MANFNDLFPSKYLKASDLPRPLRTVIADISVEDIGVGGDRKGVITFEHAKPLPLNITNGRVLAAAYGRDYSNWIGKPVELYATETDFKGERVPCVRIRIPKLPKRDPGNATAPQQPPPAAPPPLNEVLDEEVLDEEVLDEEVLY
jgi:hypothetical protein